MKAGEIYWVTLDPTIGDEIKKKRPVVILNGGHDRHLRLAVVVPVTAWHSHWKDNPFFASLQPGRQSGLKKKSAADCFQIRAIGHNRFNEKVGDITDQELDAIKNAVALILDIEPQHCL